MDTESDREPLLKPLVPTQPRSVAGIALIRHIQCIHIAVVCPFPLLPVEPGYRLAPWAWVQPLFYGQGLDGLRSDQNKHGQGNPLALTCPSHSGIRRAHLQQPGSKTLLAPNYSALPACWGGVCSIRSCSYPTYVHETRGEDSNTGSLGVSMPMSPNY